MGAISAQQTDTPWECAEQHVPSAFWRYHCRSVEECDSLDGFEDERDRFIISPGHSLAQRRDA